MKAEMLFEVIVIHSFAAFQTRDLSLGFIIAENWTNFYRSDPAVTVTSERRLLTSNLSSSSSLEHSRECVHEREGLCVWVRAHERVGKREREREKALYFEGNERESKHALPFVTATDGNEFGETLFLSMKTKEFYHFKELLLYREILGVHY